MRVRICSILSTEKTSPFAVRSSQHVIELIYFLQSGGREYLLNRFGSAPVSTKVASVNIAFHEILSNIPTQNVSCWKKSAASCRALNHATVIAQGPSRGGDQKCLFADVLVFFIKSTVASSARPTPMLVRLCQWIAPLFYWTVLITWTVYQIKGISLLSLRTSFYRGIRRLHVNDWSVRLLTSVLSGRLSIGCDGWLLHARRRLTASLHKVSWEFILKECQ